MKHISNILREEREKKGLSLEDVVAATKIKRNFLVAIEDGKFHLLPSESYALGFVKNYSEFLGIPLPRASALFRREYETKHNEIIPKFRKAVTLPGGRFSLRSSRTLLILGIIGIIAIYVIFQFSFLFVGPKLSIVKPTSGEIIESSVAQVAGKTDPQAVVTVNGEEVYVDLTGSFKKTLYVYPGETKITVTAKNRYGKETKRELQIQVE